MARAAAVAVVAQAVLGMARAACTDRARILSALLAHPRAPPVLVVVRAALSSLLFAGA